MGWEGERVGMLRWSGVGGVGIGKRRVSWEGGESGDRQKEWDGRGESGRVGSEGE